MEDFLAEGGVLRPSEPPGAPPPRRSIGATFARIVAGAAAAIGLLFAATITFGIVLAAPLGALVARALARRKAGRLTRGAAWFAAVVACFIATPVVFAGMLAMAPPGTVDAVRAVMDSAQAQPQRPAEMPEWLRKVSPPSAQRQSAATQKMVSSRPFVLIFGALGVVMACSMFGTITGSVGWVGTMLLAYAITGRWLPRADPTPFVAMPDE